MTLLLAASLPAQADLTPNLIQPCTTGSRYCYHESGSSITLYSYTVDTPPPSSLYYVGTLVGVTVTMADLEISTIAFVRAGLDACDAYLVFDNCEANDWFGPPIPVSRSLPNPLTTAAPVAYVYLSSFLGIDANADGTYEYSRTLPVPYIVPNYTP